MKLIAFLFSTLISVSFAFSKTPSSDVYSRLIVGTDIGPKIKSTNVESPWDDVNVDLNWVLANINSKNCALTQKSYLGCVLAVQLMAGLLGKNMEVMPVGKLNGLQPLLSSSQLAIVTGNPIEIKTVKDAYGYFDVLRQQLTDRFLAESAKFVKSPNSDFENLIQGIVNRYGKKISSEVYVAMVGKLLEVAIDPHTSLRPTKEMKNSQQNGSDSFVGIGVEIMVVDQGILVRRPIKGSGAATAGVLAGDLIIAVDGVSLSGKKDEDLSARLRGPENSKVVVTVRRGSQTFDLTVTRSQVVSAVVSSDTVSFNNRNVVYIRLANFMYSNACSEIEQIVATSEKLKVDGYILDLRNNGGGIVQIAACLTGIFLGPGKVVSYFEVRGKNGSQVKPMVSSAKVVTRKPLSLLINSNSASASEIVAGALRDYSRAVIVGQASFGKGSYQGCGPYMAMPGLTLCSTEGLFFSPSGETNQTKGIVPHVEVFINSSPHEIETYSLRESQLFLFPLPRKTLQVPPGVSWNQMKAPSTCLRGLGLESIYEKAPAGVFYYRDYQILNAAASVQCFGLN